MPPYAAISLGDGGTCATAESVTAAKLMASKPMRSDLIDMRPSPGWRFGSVRRFERVFCQIVRNLASNLLADFERIPEMDSAPDANIALFLRQLPDAGKLPLLLRIHEVSRRHRDTLRSRNEQL